MADNAYDDGRLKLPFVSHSTFAKRQPCLDWDAINADVSVLGVPYMTWAPSSGPARVLDPVPYASPRP